MVCSGAKATRLGDQVNVGVSQLSGVLKFLVLSLHADMTAEDEVHADMTAEDEGIHRAHLELSDAKWNCTTGALHLTGHLPTEQNSIMRPHYGKSRGH